MDDTALLDEMMLDMRKAPALYRPTQYWENYIGLIYIDLKKKGLGDDFRRRPGTLLDAFGGASYKPCFLNLVQNRRLNNHRTQRIPGFIPALHVLHRLVNEVVFERGLRMKNHYSVSRDDLRMTAFRVAQAYGRECGALPLETVEISEVGKPGDLFSIGGRNYTVDFLGYYMNYAFASQFVDFDKIPFLVELGSGMGSQAELLMKLYPRLRLYLFDIPPQLYVCEQYLKKVFPGRVVSYKETRAWKTLQPLQEGQVALLPSWHWPLLEQQKGYLFWNSASLQEMEPENVANYLRPVNAGAEWILLQEMMEGQTVARRKGGHGVLQPTTFAHYQQALSRFDLVRREPAKSPLRIYSYYDSTFWKRRQ